MVKEVLQNPVLFTFAIFFVSFVLFVLFTGWVYWDDENTYLDVPNSHSGALPDGIYTTNTLIYFCCDSRGDKSIPMLLPFGHPFFLIAFETKECQKVHGFEVRK